MDPLLYITFILTSIAIIILPGPNVLVVVSTALSHGTKRGLQTVLGTSSAMVIQLIMAAIGTTWFVAFVAQGFEWLRWLGVAYLIYLGVSHLSSMVSKGGDEHTQISGRGTFGRGFIVSLTNPKTILFFGAFLPQFVSPSGGYLSQIVVLSITFLLLATLLDSLYAVMAGKASGLLRLSWMQRVQNGISGMLFLGAGVWLAVMKKS